MAIVINGNGTITGISDGGLPNNATGLDPFALGGTITEYESGGALYRVHTFLSDSQFNVNGPLTNVDFLIVGGGGGSAAAEGYSGSTGGGGGGGLVEGTSQTIASGNYNIVVGDGGAASTDINAPASNGGNSTALGYTATGGAGGGDYEGGTRNGGSGAGGGSGIVVVRYRLT